MSTSNRLHRAITIVPLAVLSAAWTASLAGVGVTAASADEDGPQTLPDGTVLPASAIEAPASVGDDAVTRAAALSPGSASSIPQAALSAYQRAEAVINKADRGCAIPWELIAAIGRVESDHGRFGGNTLDDQGVARPGIYGIPLNGKNNTQRIADTDGGQYDDDAKWDRAVGPMQFIPSTWSVVGVDGDSDGTRNPQDIDDAALATAVYLCSGDDDLSQEKGQRASVYRYNHSNEYVDLVLSIMQAYMDGDFSAVPSSVLTSGVIMPEPTATSGGRKGSKGGLTGTGKGSSTPTVKPTKSPTKTPTQVPTQAPTQTPTQTPTQSPTKAPTTSVPTQTPTVNPTTLPTVLPTTLPPLPTATISQTLTLAEAIAQCTLQGVVDLPLTGANELLDCANRLLNP
ncbi:lytic murein transglycosylase [Nocardioides KLBMP 9356]|uniref:Lytic murein transglycosylase n=1 Tax=Nocardioides potassii TaxID=2911371 RepID=A0ABS9HFV7_9ACTN|nr:lytic murein transglycosylase [Nocardioides potassii]MCF6380027.1 lytic murein transglycosylase [Nocardioides potassii]